jgi:prephenate dehydratase
MGNGQGLKVAIQGERGAFSNEAAVGALGPEIEIVPCPGFTELFAAVSEGRADRAMVPIENSLHGSIHENYDRLKTSALHITGETQLRIRQCLIARPGATLATIRRVASHPVEAVTAYDTAGAVKDLLRGGLLTQAAIASRLAADLYGGQVLLEGIEDDAENYTRFLILAREPGPIEQANKTSVVFVLDNEPGVLYRALGLFASRGADLCKIESRPLRGYPWEYSFYLDVLGDPRGAAGDALRELEGMAREMRILGSYPEGLGKPAAA